MTIFIQAIVHHPWRVAAARFEVIHAIDAGFIATKRDLRTAVVVQADIAGVPSVLVAINKVDTLAVWSAARAAGACRCTCGILTARGEEKAGR